MVSKTAEAQQTRQKGRFLSAAITVDEAAQPADYIWLEVRQEIAHYK